MPRAGTILRVDLTEGKIEKEPTSKYVEDWFGSDGIAGKIIADELPPETKPGDPDNLLIYSTGPLTGTLRGARGQWMFKSPYMVHNVLVTSGMGGHFATELKFAGYDNLVIKGKAEKPVYLFINDDKVEIRDAGHLWGVTDTYTTQEQIKKELNDPDVQVACIGVAGENQVGYSIIWHDINNKAGKGGSGAVMGAKNLKAVAVRGTKGLKVANPDRWMEVWNEWFAGTYPEKMEPNHWTTKSMAYSGDYEVGIDIFFWGNSVKNLVCPVPPEEQKLEKFVEKYYVGGNCGCAFCPEQCMPRLVVPHIGSGSAICGIPGEMHTRWKMWDVEHWWRCVMLATRLGLDIQSTSDAISFLMELNENGITTPDETDGITVEYGSKEATLAMLEKIARREGIGAVFADGLLPAAKAIGRGAIRYARHAKGQPILNYWMWPGGQLGMAVGIGGAGTQADPASIENSCEIIEGILNVHPPMPDMTKEMINAIQTAMREAKSEHMGGDPDAWKLFEDDGETPRSTGKAKMLTAYETQTRLADLCGVCDQSTAAGPRYITSLRDFWQEMADFLTADLGEEYTPEMLQEIVDRVRLNERAYDYLSGLRREDEMMPNDWYEPITTRKWGTHVFMTREIFEKMKTEYYTLRGYDAVTGAPSRERLEQLGLKDMADRLDKIDLSPRPIEKVEVLEEAPVKRKAKAKGAKVHSHKE